MQLYIYKTIIYIYIYIIVGYYSVVLDLESSLLMHWLPFSSRRHRWFYCLPIHLCHLALSVPGTLATIMASLLHCFLSVVTSLSYPLVYPLH